MLPVEPLLALTRQHVPRVVNRVPAASEELRSALGIDGNEETLNLSHKEIGDLSPVVKNALTGLTQLTELNLSSNELTDVSALAGLTQLTSLNLSFNELTDEWVEWIKKALPKCDIILKYAIQPVFAPPNRKNPLG